MKRNLMSVRVFDFGLLVIAAEWGCWEGVRCWSAWLGAAGGCWWRESGDDGASGAVSGGLCSYRRIFM